MASARLRAGLHLFFPGGDHLLGKRHTPLSGDGDFLGQKGLLHSPISHLKSNQEDLASI